MIDAFTTFEELEQEDGSPLEPSKENFSIGANVPIVHIEEWLAKEAIRDAARLVENNRLRETG